MNDFGFVYVLGNDSMPGLYKIGMTARSPHKRCEELSRATSCPTPFKVLAYIESDDAKDSEAQLHKTFSQCRINNGREFFNCDFHRLLVELWAMSSYGYYVNRKIRDAYGITDCFYDAFDWPESQRRRAEEVAVEANHES